MAEDKVNRLNQLLLSNRKISDGYVLKEQFREIYKAKDVNGGIWSLSEWLRMTRASSIDPLKRFAKGLLKNFNEVINFFKFRISSGKIEAANASIKDSSQDVRAFQYSVPLPQTTAKLLPVNLMQSQLFTEFTEKLLLYPLGRQAL